LLRGAGLVSGVDEAHQPASAAGGEAVVVVAAVGLAVDVVLAGLAADKIIDV